jgi:hypothetical protein
VTLDITRWRGFSHAELYAQLHDGPGAQASAVPSQRWANISEALHDINHDLTAAIDQARAAWSGAAASSAFAQLADVASWAGASGESADLLRTSVEQQGDHVSRARAAMPEPGTAPTPQPDPLVAPVTQLVALQQDHEPVERATSEAALRAFEVMQAYQSDTHGTVDSLVTLPDPVDTAGSEQEQQRSRGGVREMTVHPSAAPASPGHVPVSQANAVFVEPVGDQRRPVAPPLQQGAMVGFEPTGSTATPAATTARSVNARRVSSARRAPVLPLDGAPVAPATAAPSTVASAERALPRRVGEPLMWVDDGAEPASQPRRRRPAEPEEKITESVEGAEAEVPPPVIGSGPYRP